MLKISPLKHSAWIPECVIYLSNNKINYFIINYFHNHASKNHALMFKIDLENVSENFTLLSGEKYFFFFTNPKIKRTSLFGNSHAKKLEGLATMVMSKTFPWVFLDKRNLTWRYYIYTLYNKNYSSLLYKLKKFYAKQNKYRISIAENKTSFSVILKENFLCTKASTISIVLLRCNFIFIPKSSFICI